MKTHDLPGQLDLFNPNERKDVTMQTLTLPCDTDAGDTLTLARLGGCAALTVRARQHQVNLTPADAREAARWLLACAEEVETSLARVRADWSYAESGKTGSPPCQPGCRTVTGEVNRGYCLACRQREKTASQSDPPCPSRIDSAAPSGGLGGVLAGDLATTTALTTEGPLNASAEVAP